VVVGTGATRCRCVLDRRCTMRSAATTQRRGSRAATIGVCFVTAVAGLAGLAGCSGGDGGDTAVSADFCTNVEDFEALQAEGDALFESTEDVGVEQLRDVFSRFRDAVRGLVDTAPDEVSADAELVGSTTEGLIDAYERADYDFVALATDPQYAEVLAGLDDDQITEANDRLAVYFREECGSP
jgi:hypothetical protein